MAPVTFKTKAYANILMLGDVAVKMLEMMGYGTSIPGAIDIDDLPEALQNLEQALGKVPPQIEAAVDAEDDQPAVSLQNRAIPLLELLQAAIDDKTYVRWE
jgi:hypothetical protein